jgi:hypothetical protein
MQQRGLLAALVLTPAMLALPLASQAQGVAVDHKEVKCIVAGKFTRMAACFDPGPALARGRVYFRAGGTVPWYFVEFKPDAPCFTTYLPKAKPEIKLVDYYVEGLGKDSSANRTADFQPIVVEHAEDCKDRPAGAFVNKASIVVGAVGGGPAIPAGFVLGTGIGSTAIIGGVAAAGVIGGAVAIASGGDNGSGPTATLPPPTTTPPTTPPPPTTLHPPPPTTQPAYEFRPVFRISPDPPIGTEPLPVTFDMCDSRGEGLHFRFDFDGDGSTDLAGTQCSATRTYSIAGVSASGGPPPPPPPGPTTLAPRKAHYPTLMTVLDDRGNHASEGNTVAVIESLKASEDASGPARRLAWSSELNLNGGSGQVVVNGSAASFAAQGRSSAVALGRRGENRVEAQVVQAAGSAGTWRFELGATTSLKPGSLRVSAGEVALVTADAIVFRLTGKSGERVAFTFRTGD